MSAMLPTGDNPRPPAQAPPSCTSTSTETLDQVDALLTYIRANLSNIRQTWGVESRQYASAIDIMQAYLTENLERLKRPGMLDPSQTGVNKDAGGQSEQATTVRREREVQIERSIEELMRDLALGV